MRSHFTRRIPLAVGVVLALAVLALGFPASASPDAPNPGHAWTELENHGTSGAPVDTYWLGTPGTQALELRVNGYRILRLDNAYNVVEGTGNVTPGVTYATISGGSTGGFLAQKVTDYAGTIGGGAANIAGDNAGTTTDAGGATVGGGILNWAKGGYSAVGGGGGNQASGEYATVGGGTSNVASGPKTTVGGGESNEANSEYATVGGGWDNTSSSLNTVVGGGRNNVASGISSTVGGGQSNVASDMFPTIGGGNSNQAQGYGTTVAGGDVNQAINQRATVGGGSGNVASGTVSTVGGGNFNQAQGGAATVGGGSNNQAQGQDATVGGGETNQAQGQKATVGGGQSNTASGISSTIGGGSANQAQGDSATVGGGQSNVASGIQATIGGGNSNQAQGLRATVPGGYGNIAVGDSFAAGMQAQAVHTGAFVWADPTGAAMASTLANQFTVRASGGTRFFSNAAANIGVQLAPGGNAWAAISDRSVKANFESVDGRDVLDRLASIPVETWNLESQDESIRHMGPMAQDFYAAFGLGEDDRHITTVDADGVALAAIQGLYELVQETQAENAALEARIAQLEAGAPTGGAAAAAAGSPGLPPAWPLLGGGLALVLVGLVVVRRLAAGRP